jgi:hypothetical protein
MTPWQQRRQQRACSTVLLRLQLLQLQVLA